jgi:hypothetical protein
MPASPSYPTAYDGLRRSRQNHFNSGTLPPTIHFSLILGVHIGVLERRLRAAVDVWLPPSLKIKNSDVPTFGRPENEQADLLVGGVVGSYHSRQAVLARAESE